MMAHLAGLMTGRQAYRVGVHCSLETLAAREGARGNRLKGLSALLFQQPHRRAIYDVEVDTTAMAPWKLRRRFGPTSTGAGRTPSTSALGASLNRRDISGAGRCRGEPNKRAARQAIACSPARAKISIADGRAGSRMSMNSSTPASAKAAKASAISFTPP